MGISLATATLIAMAAAAAASAAGTAISSIQQSKQADYQSKVAENNNVIAQQMAQDALNRGQAKEQEQRRKTAALISNQRTAFAANGVDINSGSAVDVQADTAGLGELDALNIRNNAQREAYGFQSQGMNYSAQSDLYKYSADTTMANMPLNTATSALGGASSVASKWYSFNKMGATT